ncbi:aromatic ring-hydroxylating dioxygenase subunit alpha [Streptomyces sp. UH6]|uniref:aromatic ring-hydroxylating oxygenase subunit alpha n=1 Tax=Streptomyces sp. UH6 TaxID=2748379 RepID=UPI0015D4B33F|nr:aromatic ring-hydroxylating dioxygenase subunit alpha [Streptomyces sp. UH6]NYV77572.1 aromatic ring-hydroxylating dioxygenase subunit alpha [Streptomyces sp. UH6]
MTSTVTTTTTGANPAVEELAERIHATGLRNQWYPVLPSDQVAAGSMKRVTRWNEPWLLFRRPSGELHMIADRCPHRSAPLSLGQHLGDRVACLYHGVQVDGTGTVVSVPGLPGCNLEGKQLVRSLPVQEHCGAIFAYWGDEQHPEPPELVLPDRLSDPETAHFLNYAEWGAPWRFYIDNVLDPMHGAFLHGHSHSMSGGAKSARFRIRETGRGFFFEKTDQVGVNFDWVEFGRTGVDWVDLEIPYQPYAGPGGAFGIVGMVVPVTDTECAVFHWRTRKVQGWERDSWRFLYRMTLEERHHEVLEQDRVMLEGMPADGDVGENLYQHDLGVVRIRRLYRSDATRQAQALTTG